MPEWNITETIERHNHGAQQFVNFCYIIRIPTLHHAREYIDEYILFLNSSFIRYFKKFSNLPTAFFENAIYVIYIYIYISIWVGLLWIRRIYLYFGIELLYVTRLRSPDAWYFRNDKSWNCILLRSSFSGRRNA